LGLPVKATDYLAITSCDNKQTSRGIAVGYRFRDSTGKVIDDYFVHTTSASLHTFLTTIADRAFGSDGELLSISITNGSGAGVAPRGSCYVLVQLVTGTKVTNSTSKAVLISDFLTTQYQPGWPTAPFALYEGGGWIHTIQVTNPGAGLEWTLTVPNNTRMRIRGVRFSAAIANSGAARLVTLKAGDGTNTFGVYASSNTLAINATTLVDGIPQTAFWAEGGSQEPHIGLPPDLTLGPGFTLGSNSGALVAGDSYTSIFVDVEEWVDDPN